MGHYCFGKWGLKDTNDKTLLEPRFDELYGFSIDDAGLWAIAGSPEEWLSDFEFDDVVKKSPLFGFAYAFKGSQVFTVDETGAYPADKNLVQDDVEDRYSSYYFDKHVLRLLKMYIRE